MDRFNSNRVVSGDALFAGTRNGTRTLAGVDRGTGSSVEISGANERIVFNKQLKCLNIRNGGRKVKRERGIVAWKPCGRIWAAFGPV